MEITEKQLAELLKEAQEAHHEYEKTLIDRDDEWALWYAHYINNKLKNNIQ